MRVEVRLRHAFRDLRLDVAFESQGPVLGLVGPSGAGKSTVLHVLAGLLRPAEARIVLEGDVLASVPGGRWMPPERRRIGWVPQDGLLFPHRDVAANLVHAPGARAALGDDAGRRIVEVLRLGPLRDRRTSTLSGGERQRVALGRALLATPRLLLLDEPTSALDADLARETLALLRDVKERLGTAMVVVTHRTADLLSLADEVVRLEAGRVVDQGAPLDVLVGGRGGTRDGLGGLDNVLAAIVAGHDEAGGTTELDVAGARLRAPYVARPIGKRVLVGLQADDLLLAVDAPPRTSARNALPAVVQSLDLVGSEVLVRLGVGEGTWLARITPAAVRDLALETGGPVVVLVKTTACRYLE